MIKLKAQDLASGEYVKELSCLSAVPLKIVDAINHVEDMSAVVGGMMGYYKHDGATSTVLQAAHGWCLLLPAASPLRR